MFFYWCRSDSKSPQVSRTLLSILADLDNVVVLNGVDFTSDLQLLRRCPRGVMVKARDFGIVISEFELKSRYYVHFRTNTLGKGMNPRIL